MKKVKKIPKFKNEDEEREFWLTHSTMDYIENFEPVDLYLPNLKPTTRSISIRLPEWMIDQLKAIANKHDVPYQSMVKIFLGEKIKEETAKSA